MNTKDLDSLKIKFGQYIRFKRLKLGYKGRRFAVIADVEPHQLINIEKGRVDLRLSTILKIARGFNIGIEDLITEAMAHREETPS